MTKISRLTLGVEDTATPEAFYAALGVDDRIGVAASDEPTSGFRGYTISLVVSQPGNVEAFESAALDAGAASVKPAKRSFWGYAAVVRAPDGALWKIATSSKKDSVPPSRTFDQLVLLLGVDDVKTTKQFYEQRGLAVRKGFGSKYVEFDTSGSPVGLGLYSRRFAAKDAGVPPEGSGSHRLAVAGDLGTFTDPDGFVWESS